MRDIGILTALGAGLLTFLSPCVLPLIPGWLSFISGYGFAELREGKVRFRILFRTIAFTAGFSSVFVILGLILSRGSFLLGGLSGTLTLAAGGIIMLLGLNLVFDFLKFLNIEARFHPGKAPGGFFGAFLIGLAFAAGWTPCVGPILASILLYAGREGSAGRATILLSAYSLGLALPFLAASLFFEALRPLMDWFKRRARGVRIVSGLLLVALGAGMALGRLGAISSIASRSGMALKESLLTAPERLRVIGACAWLALALLALILPILRKRSLFRPLRILAIAVPALIAAGELAGFWSSARIISEWLLFQGA